MGQKPEDARQAPCAEAQMNMHKPDFTCDKPAAHKGSPHHDPRTGMLWGSRFWGRKERKPPKTGTKGKYRPSWLSSKVDSEFKRG